MTGYSISMDRTPNDTEPTKELVCHPKTSVEQRLKFFMHDVTGRALVMMETATQNQQGIAMDLVQEAFIALHRAYPNKTLDEWYPLFYTILNNKLQDWRRKEKRHTNLFSFFRKGPSEDEIDEEINIADEQQLEPSLQLVQTATIEEIRSAIQDLPTRQQQAFMLRAWEEFDTQTTAQIMQCTEGSVKTHYHRAIQSLKQKLSHLHNEYGGSSHES
ncbi:RNA polymerase sigma factor [Acinetobacter nectaris]|uniref:RNA polymerase sigma factor n=1 Tax=Acinetobacter nectaris TaxID=1219382 RepID=UPI001F008B4A|nr:RNA polymerase sigma factor [Acinetobacter nectaris]MCF8998903.1 RNA polymerase sigma factor [Acinetobacter nectaris]MCF9027504.1 RNA polymerase sigma factor [Acinetobacter nectaris]